MNNHTPTYDGNRFIKNSKAGLFSNPVVGGVTVETPKVETPPLRAGRGHEENLPEYSY